MRQAPSRFLSTNSTLILLCLLALASAKFAFASSKSAEPSEPINQSFHHARNAQ